MAWAAREPISTPFCRIVVNFGTRAEAKFKSAVPITLSSSLDGGELEVRIQAQSGRCLDIEFAIQPDATLSVAAWKATTLWAEDTTDHLWTGGAATGDADGGDGAAPAGSTSPTGSDGAVPAGGTSPTGSDAATAAEQSTDG